MVAKFVFCAVLCLALSQAALARPDEGSNNNDHPYTEAPQALTCKQNLQELGLDLINLFRVYYDGLYEFFYGLYRTAKCAFSQNFAVCSKEVLASTYENFKPIFSAYVEKIQMVGRQLYSTAKTCFSKQQLEFVEPFLSGNNFDF